MAAARYVNICYTRTTCASVKCNTSFKSIVFMESRFNVNFVYLKFKVTHFRSTTFKCGVLIGDTVGCLSTRHVIKMLNEFSNFSVIAIWNDVVYIFNVNVKVCCCCSLCICSKQSRIIMCNTSFPGS